MSDQFYLVQFAEARQPEYKENKAEGFVNYGVKNDYPEYLVELFNKSAKHNAIIKGKVHYITGNGWSGNEQFIDNPNRVESLDELTRKLALDIELFGGTYIEVIWGMNQNISEIWHIDYTKVRTNKDNTQFWYKADWKDRNEKAKIYPAFNPKQPIGSQIFYLKEYRPAIKTYSLPSYFGALNYIESDIEVSKHVLGNAKTGFSASKLITLPNGEPSPEEKNEIHKKFKNTYTGADGIKYMLSFVNDASRKPIIDDLGQSDLTREDFSRVDEMIQVNIFSGHQITTPSIFGIAEAGKLGSRTEMRDGYEIFKNTYVNGKQMQLESTMNMLCSYFGYQGELKIIPTNPISIDLSETILSQIMTKDELREMQGLKALEVKQTSTNQDVIDAINTLSPLVANKVLEELTSNELRALISLPPKEGGDTVSTAPTTNTNQVPVMASEELGEYKIFYSLGEEKEKFNVWKQKSNFKSETDMYADISQLKADVLGLIDKDNKITPEVISETLGENVDLINHTIKSLEDDGYIKSKVNIIGKGNESNIEIVRTLTAPISEIIGKVKPITTEFLVRYSYEWIKGYSDKDKKTSREFCKHLLKANKMYSRQDIERMSAYLGYSVWDRRGGWWTKPDGTHSESCRHEWKSNIVTRKK